MADLSDFFRWQWMWKSRPRLIAIAIGAMAFGVALILYAALSPGLFTKAKGLIIFGGVMFAAFGGYQLLQGIFSPTGAFGEPDPRDVPRAQDESKRKRKRRREPVRCPECAEVVSKSATECPKCSQRLVQD